MDVIGGHCSLQDNPIHCRQSCSLATCMLTPLSLALPRPCPYFISHYCCPRCCPPSHRRHFLQNDSALAAVAAFAAASLVARAGLVCARFSAVVALIGLLWGKLLRRAAAGGEAKQVWGFVPSHQYPRWPNIMDYFKRILPHTLNTQTNTQDR
eukprot:1153475-Pelagomonas_calceolata.AAC.8